MAARGRVPGRSQELIFLDIDDDLGTIRAKLESSPAEEIFLVVPSRAGTLRTALEFRILARMAHELSTDVTIVSSEGRRRQLAGQEGLRTRRGYGGVRHLAEAAGAPRPLLPPILDWVPLPSLSAVLVLGVVGALVAAVALVAMPVLRVTVTPASESTQRDLELIVDPAARTPDPSRGLLPGKPLQSRLDVAGSVPSTGQRSFGRDAARGEVVFSNGSGNAVVLPARSVVVARNGVRFLLDGELRVNPFSYGVARVGVTAEQRGTVGNVDISQMASVDPPVPGLTVTNPKPMAGGSDRQGKAVTAADLARIKEQLMQRARDQALAQFTAEGGGQALSVPASTLQLKVEAENYQPAVDGEGDQVSGTMTVSATAVGWDNQGLNTLVQRMLLSNYPPDFSLPMSQLRLQPPEVLDNQEGRMRVRVRADALVVRTLDPDPIAEQLRWKSSAEARNILQGMPGVSGTPRVDLTPAWAPRAYRVEVAVSAPK